ncbi:MAG: glycoside hydrolase domain-containing protein, partial [Limisphaerales bacterium]
FVFSALGIYPEIPGVAGFVTGSPLFPRVVIRPQPGSARQRAENRDTTIQIIGRGASPDNCYVRKLTVNGRPGKRVWIPWSELSNGGVLDFTLTGKPAPWGKNSRPPSFD